MIPIALTRAIILIILFTGLTLRLINKLKVATNTGKTKYIIISSKNKKIYLSNQNGFFYNAKDHNAVPNPDLITILESYHNDPENKIKLLVIQTMRYLLRGTFVAGLSC
jgi:hypothetical protein